jgi:hypothetical protein
MFVSHRQFSYKVDDVEIVPGFRIVVYEGDYFPAPDHEFIYLLDDKQVYQELVPDRHARFAEIQANPQAFVDELRAREAQKTPVQRAWEKGGFGKPL